MATFIRTSFESAHIFGSEAFPFSLEHNLTSRFAMTKVILPPSQRSVTERFSPYNWYSSIKPLHLRKPMSSLSGATSRKRNSARRPLHAAEREDPFHRFSGTLKRSTTPDDLRSIALDSQSSNLHVTESLEELCASSEDEVTSASSEDLSDARAKPEHTFGRTRTTPKKPREQRQMSIVKEVDVEKYMTSRQMTTTQEHWNAYTMIPSPLFCLYYILSAKWMPSSDAAMQDFGLDGSFTGHHDDSNHGCFGSSVFHSMPSLPPLPVLMIGAAIILHAPFSFAYHFQFAHRLHNPIERTSHISRRLDHAMIHVASALMSYSTSGSWHYFFINCLYNADCAYRHLAIQRVKPRANQLRILVSMLAYTMPVWKQGQQPAVFLQIWLCFLLSVWFFVAYPIGGWSHSVFHLIIAMAIPILMDYAVTIPASQAALQLAVACRETRA